MATMATVATLVVPPLVAQQLVYLLDLYYNYDKTLQASLA